MSFSLAGDLKNTAFSGGSIFPQTIASNTTVNGTYVDCLLTDDHLSAVITLGDYGDATTTLAVKLQEADTSGGSGVQDISGATASFAASATANDNTVTFITTRLRSKRYVRVVATTAAGASISVPISVTLIGRKKITGTGTGYVT
jgi:hypothetical protein